MPFSGSLGSIRIRNAHFILENGSLRVAILSIHRRYLNDDVRHLTDAFRLCPRLQTSSGGPDLRHTKRILPT